MWGFGTGKCVRKICKICREGCDRLTRRVGRVERAQHSAHWASDPSSFYKRCKDEGIAHARVVEEMKEQGTQYNSLAGRAFRDRRLNELRRATTLGEAAPERRCLIETANGEWGLPANLQPQVQRADTTTKAPSCAANAEGRADRRLRATGTAQLTTDLYPASYSPADASPTTTGTSCLSPSFVSTATERPSSTCSGRWRWGRRRRGVTGVGVVQVVRQAVAAVTQDDGKSPDPASDDEPQGCQTALCGNCGDAYDPYGFKGKDRRHLCKLCVRGYEWLRRRYHPCLTPPCIKSCGTARTRVLSELKEKQISSSSALGRKLSALRMKQLCTPGELGLGEVERPLTGTVQTQWADSIVSGLRETRAVSGLRETRADQISRLDALRVAQYGPRGVVEGKFAAVGPSKCTTIKYPTDHAPAAAILSTTGTSGLPHSGGSRATERRFSQCPVHSSKPYTSTSCPVLLVMVVGWAADVCGGMTVHESFGEFSAWINAGMNRSAFLGCCDVYGGD